MEALYRSSCIWPGTYASISIEPFEFFACHSDPPRLIKSAPSAETAVKPADVKGVIIRNELKRMPQEHIEGCKRFMTSRP